tara:strand:+ start:4419 stop:4727 length:309 start_codon:yes stop_codon:yes gene_type:complete
MSNIPSLEEIVLLEIIKQREERIKLLEKTCYDEKSKLHDNKVKLVDILIKNTNLRPCILCEEEIAVHNCTFCGNDICEDCVGWCDEDEFKWSCNYNCACENL